MFGGYTGAPEGAEERLLAAAQWERDVAAKALRDAADEAEAVCDNIPGHGEWGDFSDWLRERADHIEQSGECRSTGTAPDFPPQTYEEALARRARSHFDSDPSFKRLIQTVREGGGDIEIDGVKITRCDEFGRTDRERALLDERDTQRGEQA